MYYHPSVKTRAIMELGRRRSGAERCYEELRAKAVKAIPELEELEIKIASACAELCLVIGMGDEALSNIERIKSENLWAQKKQRELLIKHGFPPDSMKLRYNCSVCNDTGFGDNGRFCECHKLLLKELEHERLNEHFPLDGYTFESFSLDFYPAAQRSFMSETLEFCKNYAAGFDLEMPNLFFFGGTGLGKTHLSGAIVNGVIARGYGVEYGSAPLLFQQLTRERFDSRSSEITQKALLSADLLVLDDLGAEVTNAITIELLYTVMNTRNAKKLPTIINSNCEPEELKARYSQKIASRLLYDEYRAFAFTGIDIREQMAKDAAGL